MIEFKMEPTKKDIGNANISLMVRSKLFVSLVVFLLTLLIALNFIGFIFPVTENLVSKIGAVIIAALILPFILCMGIGKMLYKQDVKVGDRNHFVTKEGYGVKYDQQDDVFFNWEEYISVRETLNYIFLKNKTGANHTIFKKYVPEEKLSQIKDVLSEASVKKKHLLSN